MFCIKTIALIIALCLYSKLIIYDGFRYIDKKVINNIKG